MKSLFVSVICLVLSGCVAPFYTESDISQHESVKGHIGREFVTRTDVYLCQSHIELLDSYPDIEVPFSQFNYGSPRLPYPVDKSYVGEKSKYFTCVGILPSGTKITIIRVMHYREPTSNFTALIFKTDDENHGTIQYSFGASINDAKFPDFRLGKKRWVIGLIADEVEE